jgi:phenylacetate-CoA ligase
MRLMPTLRRAVVEPLWATVVGSCLRRGWRQLEASQTQPSHVLMGRQWTALKDLLRFAWDNNSFYRHRLLAAGIAPDAIRTPSDFSRLPILEKREVMDHGHAMISNGFAPEYLIHAKTGGTTGRPLELVFTEEVSELRNACGRRHKRWAGWEVGEPVAWVWGNPDRPGTLRGALRAWLLDPVIYLDTMSVTVDTVRAFAEEWRRIRPTMIFGHAHSIFLLAEIVRRHSLENIKPNAIVSSSMMLLPHERRVIEQVFATEVFDMYGCEEVGMIACECERHEGLHINVDQLVVEVVDSNGVVVGPGQEGSVVVTDLLNRAMPLIRYRLEDIAEVAASPCSCGRGLPLLRRVTGRVADFLVTTDGRRVQGISLIENTLTRIPGLDQMQIEQPALRAIMVRVVKGKAFTSGTHRALVDYFTGVFPGAQIDVEDVVEIPREANGKYRFSICRVPELY